MSPLSPAPASFSEQQGFLRPWWWLLVALTAVMAGTAAGFGFSAPRGLSLSLTAVPLVLVGLFAWLRLDTRVNAQGIAYRMRPLGWHHLRWADVQRAYVRDYSPLGEYGGWGIKGPSRQNYAFNVSGTHGLQLELVDGRRVLLGTRRAAELQSVIEQWQRVTDQPAEVAAG